MARTRRSPAGRTTPAQSARTSWTTNLRRVGIALVCAKVALVPLTFDVALDFPFAVAKGLLSHALAYVLASVIAALFIVSGSSFVVRSWLHWPVLGFIAANAIATVFAADRTLALFGTHARMLGFGTVIDWVLLYFAIVLLVRTRTEATAVVASALGGSLLVVGYEFVQITGRDPLQWNSDTTQRPISTIGQATSLAQYLTTVAVGTLGLGLLVDGLGRRVRGVLIAYAVILLIGAVATGTRSSLVGVTTGAIALMAFIWLVHERRRTLVIVLFGASVAAGALSLIFVPTFLGARLGGTLERLQSDTSDEDLLSRLEPLGADRSALYKIGFDILRERPLFGYGPDNFVVGVPRYRPEGAHPQIQQSLATSGHSWVTYVASSSGLAGLAAFVATVMGAFVLALRHGRHTIALAGAALLAAFLGTGLTTVSEIGTDWLLWSAIAMVVAATNTSARAMSAQGSPKPRDSRRLTERVSFGRRTLAVGCVVVGVLIAMTAANAFGASRSARASQDARLVGRGPQALDLGLGATKSDPSRGEYWHTLGLAYVATARWRDAATAFGRSVDLQPYNSSYIGDLAQVQLVLANGGDSAARARAVELADDAVRTDPNNPRAHLTRAGVMQATGNVPEALRSVQRAIVLDPQSTNPALYVAACQVFTASGRASECVLLARQGLALIGETNQSISLRLELARALVATGQRAEALAELDVALRIRPNDPTVERLRSEIRSSQ
jgi:O-antigen ligase/Flp pilus assembly protein TadD